MATFVFDNTLATEELFPGSLQACHNGNEECHTGALPPPNADGNTVSFPGANPWEGPSVWSPDHWQTIQFSWSSLNAMALHDGDRFSLTFVRGETQKPLFDHAATFEIVNDCAGTCQSARYDLRGADLGGGGTAGTGEAGASSPGTEAGGASEGGATGN
jgi:hypothetical protein